MLGKGTRGQTPNAVQSKSQATLRIDLHCVQLSSLLHTVGCACSFSSPTPGGATGCVPPQNWPIRATSPLWGDSLVRSAHAPSFPFAISRSPPLSVFSALGAGKAWALVPALRRAGARDTLSRADTLRPLPCMRPPGSSCPSSLPVSPRLKVGPFRVPVTSSRAGLAPSWMTPGEGSLELAKVKSLSVHFTCFDPTITNTSFFPAYPFRLFTTPRLSPPISAFFSHPDSVSSLS